MTTMWHEWSTLEKLIWLRRRIGGGASWVWRTITGAAPLTLANAVHHAIKSLTQYGLCTQATTPTPDAPVDIMCNNGAIKFGWHDIITTSQLSGYGTYVSPSQTATTRAYRWFRDLPNGTYTFAVSGDYEIIVQWRDPADPADGLAQGYENLSGWITSGEVTLDKSTGGYGIAVKRSSGTSSITPANFDGVLHVAARGIYTDGTDEVLTVSADGAEAQTVTDIPMLLSVGDYEDEAEIISGIKTGKVRAYAIDGTENWTMSSSVSGVFLLYPADMKPCNPPIEGLSTHFKGTSASTASMPDLSIKNTYGSGGAAVLCVRYNAKTSVADFKADAAAAFASGNPWIALYPLATETTEQGTAHALHTSAGTNVVDVTANVSPVELEVEYASNN